MGKYVPINTDTLTRFAGEARRISGTESEMSTAEMLDTFGSAEVVKNQDVTITENGVFTADSDYTGFGKVTVTVETGGGSGGDYEDANEKYY